MDPGTRVRRRFPLTLRRGRRRKLGHRLIGQKRVKGSGAGMVEDGTKGHEGDEDSVGPWVQNELPGSKGEW